MLKKRGIGIDLMTTLILALVFIIVATNFYRQYSIGAAESRDVEACKFSVLKNSEFRVTDKTPGEISGIECPKRELEISEKLVDRYKIGSDSNAREEYGAKYEIANAMRLCWYQWGRGKLSPFDTGWLETGKIFCALCYDVSFDNDFRAGHKNLGDFIPFLMEERIPDGTTYFANYFRNVNDSSTLSDSDIQAFRNDVHIEDIDTSQDYAIVYKNYKQGYLLNTLGLSTGTVIAGAAGCKIGSIVGTTGSPIGTAIGCGVGFIGGAAGTYFFGISEPSHDAQLKLIPSSMLREEGCEVLYQ